MHLVIEGIPQDAAADAAPVSADTQMLEPPHAVRVKTTSQCCGLCCAEVDLARDDMGQVGQRAVEAVDLSHVAHPGNHRGRIQVRTA